MLVARLVVACLVVAETFYGMGAPIETAPIETVCAWRMAVLAAIAFGAANSYL